MMLQSFVAKKVATKLFVAKKMATKRACADWR